MDQRKLIRASICGQLSLNFNIQLRSEKFMYLGMTKLNYI